MTTPIRSRRKNSPGEWGPWRSTSAGYLRRTLNEEGRTKYELQHRFVMEEHLGRELLPNENVHHKNGIRDDNRVENLELWVTAQPSGQRPQDLIYHALDVLEEYLQDSWDPEVAQRLRLLLAAGPMGVPPAQVRRELER